LNYWLLKSEPDVYSIDDLKRDKKTFWDGVRNYQARNFLRDSLKNGDLVLFYHSNAEPPGVAGLAKVVREGYPDPTAFDPKDSHYDPKSDPANPTWYVVDVQFVKKAKSVVGLPELKQTKGLEKMVLLQKGSRLSVQPVTATEFAIVSRMAGF
jgi:predicted RNA-binding protein with PUA-like domain